MFSITMNSTIPTTARRVSVRNGRPRAVWATGVACLSLAVPTALAPTAFAATSETQNFHQATFSDHVPNFADCTGLDQPGVVTFVGNVVVHMTTLPDGTSHFTTTATGTLSYVPDNASLLTFSGRLVQWDGDNDSGLTQTATTTVTVHGTLSDGSSVRLHETDHLTQVSDTPVVEFERLRCG